MARLGTAGFESQFLSSTAGSGPEPVIRNNSNSVISTSGARSGDACVSIPDAAINYIRGDWTKTANRWFYIRAQITVDALPAADRNIAVIVDGATPIWTVVLKSDGTMYLSGQAGAGSSAAIAANEYHCLEIAVWGNGSSSKRIKLRLDGTQFVDFTSSGSPTTYGDQFRYGFTSGGNTGLTMKCDDVAWNDDTGSDQNSWPGITGKVANLLPTADSAIGSDWKLGTGSNPGGNAFEALNNTPPLGVSNGSAGSDTKQIRDNVNGTGSPASDADLTMAAYDSELSGTVRVLQAVASLGQTSASNTMDAEVGLVSNPTETRPTVQIPAGAAGTFGAGWQSRYGAVHYDPAPTLGTSPVARVGKRTATATTLLCCYLALVVEYDPETTAELVGTADVTFAGTGSMDSTADIAGSSAVAFDGQGTLIASGTLAGSSEIHFSASAVPPTGFANLVSTASIQFDATGQADAWMLFSTADIHFAATITPPTGLAVLQGGASIAFGGFGALQHDIPPTPPSGFEARWASGRHVGGARPGMRVQVRLGRLNRRHQPWLGALPDREATDMDGVYIPGIDPSFNTSPWQASWEPYTAYVDVPNVRDCRLEKSQSNRGLTTATLTIDNIIYAAEGIGDAAHHEIRRGYLAPLRGYVPEGGTALIDEQGQAVGENEWRDVLSRQAQITVWQSYGDLEVKTFTGLIDDVDATSRPDVLTVTARCFGQVLADERVFGWNKEPDIKDPVVFIDREAADDIVKVGYEAAASSEHDARHTAANVSDGDGDTDWWSAFHTITNFTEYVQVRLPEGRYSDYYLNVPLSGMDAYVSLYVHAPADGSATKDGDDIPTGWAAGPGQVPGGNGGQDYIVALTDLPTEGHVRSLGAEYVVGEGSLLRLSFRNLAVIDPPGSAPYGAAVTALRGRRRKRVAEARTQHWVLVQDVSDVVKQILRWAGFKEWEIETTGVSLSKRWLANRGMTYLDVIQKMAETVGYTFFIGDPSEDPNSIGVPIFRQTRAVQAVPAVITVTDRDLLTAVKVTQRDESLAYIIRVRGRESDDGQRLGGSETRRVMYTFRPPWSHQLDQPLTDDRLGGVIKHVIHTDHLFRSVDDCKFGAYYIALQEALESIKATCEFPAYPGVDLDDHVALLDLATGVTSRLLLTDRASMFVRTAEETRWTMTVGGSLVDTPDVSEMVAIINAAKRS